MAHENAFNESIRGQAKTPHVITCEGSEFRLALIVDAGGPTWAIIDCSDDQSIGLLGLSNDFRFRFALFAGGSFATADEALAAAVRASKSLTSMNKSDSP